MATDPITRERRIDRALTGAGFGCALTIVLALALAVPSLGHSDGNERLARAASQAACRSWDARTADGSLTSTVGSIDAVAQAAVGQHLGRGYFAEELVGDDAILEALEADATEARNAAQGPLLDRAAYRAFRDLATSLTGLRASVAAGEVLDVAQVRVPEYRRSAAVVESLCQPYV